MARQKGLRIDEITPKQKAFVLNYCSKTSTTFGNAYKSYTAAGYSNKPSAMTSACQLLSNPKIALEIAKYKPETTEITLKKQEITGQYADQQVILGIEGCKDSGGKIVDMTNFVALCRLLQQRCGQLSDRMVIDVNDSRRLDLEHDAQNKRIAAFMVSHGLLAEPDTHLIPASFETVSTEIVSRVNSGEK
ncbi:MAG: terminase small subunit [Planctomycetes bacterium]|nr:terminase small subunit [Planctomycetota bacterium]